MANTDLSLSAPNVLAQAVAVALRQSGIAIPAGEVDQLESYILEGYEEMKSIGDYDPEADAVAMARNAVRDYAMYRYLSVGPYTAQSAANAFHAWNGSRRKWSKAAAREYWRTEIDSRLI